MHEIPFGLLGFIILAWAVLVALATGLDGIKASWGKGRKRKEVAPPPPGHRGGQVPPQ